MEVLLAFRICMIYLVVAINTVSYRHVELRIGDENASSASYHRGLGAGLKQSKTHRESETVSTY